ncbi:MAG: Sterol desaturase [Pseudomonas sp.]|nr:Sterol desaturase [Pseudomonas sp.]
MSDFMQWAMAGIEHNAKALIKAALVTGVAWAIEVCRPAATDPGLVGRWHNFRVFIYLLAGLAISSPFMDWCARLVPEISLIERVLPNWQKEGLVGGIVGTAVYALVWDFFQYWTHRLEHRFAVLWVFHRVHHSDMDVNSSTALRQSVGSIVVNFLLTQIPTIIICGGNMIPYLGFTLLFSGWGCFTHANVRVPLGPFTHVLSGPQWHRLHHGKDSHYHGCNFAAFFPFLDLMFGTLKAPTKDEWVETGLQGDTLPPTPFIQAFFPWRNELPATSNTPHPCESTLLQGCPVGEDPASD